MHRTESRLVIGPSNVQSAGMYVCTFQPGNITGCGSEGVKIDVGQAERLINGVHGHGAKCHCECE